VTVPRVLAAAVVLLLAGCTAGSTPAATPVTSPAALPPGALNPAVSQATIDTTVCVPRWTASIRPNLPTRPGHQYDHVISLSLGGAPTDGANLSYVPTDLARRQDVLETLLHRLVCAHKVTLADAQRLVLAIKRGA
jgi:hypothetical protein